MKVHSQLKMSSIYIYNQTSFKHGLKASDIKNLIKYIFINEGKSFTSLNIIFCDDEYLLKINQNYLNHDTYTDIITFNYSSAKIEGEIYISSDRLLENAKKRKISYNIETVRLIIHGVLHLCGYEDKTKSSKLNMTKKENIYLTHTLNIFNVSRET